MKYIDAKRIESFKSPGSIPIELHFKISSKKMFETLQKEIDEFNAKKTKNVLKVMAMQSADAPGRLHTLRINVRKRLKDDTVKSLNSYSF